MSSSNDPWRVEAWRKKYPSRAKAARKAYYEANKDKYIKSSRKSWLKRNYNLTQEQFDVIGTSQNWLCAICHCGDKKLVVDHDHSTGKIRGLLCAKCNLSLGLFNDSADRLRQAAEYVER